jgi:hypothetical protein
VNRTLKTVHNSVLGSEKSSTYPGVDACELSLLAAVLDGCFEHPGEEMVLA